MPAATHTMLMWDFNLVEDPELDKTSKLGSARVSSRIDRALVSASMLGCIGGAFHTSIPKGITDHWFAISVKLTSSEGKAKGPGLWRLPEKIAKSQGVRNIAQAITQQQDADDHFVKTLKKLNACLKEYAKGERRRVACTIKHLEEKVAVLKQAFMSDAGNLDLQEQLARSEAQLKVYWDGKNDWLQTLAGIQGELEGENVQVPHGEDSFKESEDRDSNAFGGGGETVTEAKEILLAASDFFRDLFGKAKETSGEKWSTDRSKRLDEEDREVLQAKWTEK
ncbi:unnamed protein product [Closterium sp. NIES-64]|nr:unnamed protein product [Closterium sp. NIES-64]